MLFPAGWTFVDEKTYAESLEATGALSWVFPEGSPEWLVLKCYLHALNASYYAAGGAASLAFRPWCALDVWREGAFLVFSRHARRALFPERIPGHEIASRPRARWTDPLLLRARTGRPIRSRLQLAG